MAITTIIVALLACGLIGGGVAYGELHTWDGARLAALYATAGLMASELVAAPLIFDLFGLRSGWVESVSMASALAVGLYVARQWLPD